MMRFYTIETKRLPDSSIVMFNEIESLFIYMLQLAERNNINMNQLIKNTTEAGRSILYDATLHSEKISHELIKRKVKVNSINNEFRTPVFKVR